MTVTLLLAGALMSQSAALPAYQGDHARPTDVAYEELASGQTDTVIARLRARAGDDPAALINLGAAYARKGMKREAMACFTRAMVSDQRYQIQLEGGSWVDSRAAAHMAAAHLEQGASTFSMR